MQRVGVVEGAIGGADRFASLAALFPHVSFDVAGQAWPVTADRSLDILIVPVNGADAPEVEAALTRLSATRSPAIVVVLSAADVTTTRRLTRAGAADVLLAPVSEPALALSLERLLTAGLADREGASGEVLALLKAGGGVGATSIGVQTAAMAAGLGRGDVCFVDLDLQFGAGAVYLDLPDAITIADVLSSGATLGDTPFGSALARHKSGLRLLAAPREVMALETMSPNHADALLLGLRRDFALTVVDLPTSWTIWTNQVLHSADRIVLITQLSVPHIQLVKRQLRVLASQGLDTRPITLVCNALTPDQSASVSIKAAEKALGRAFDVIIPDDRKTMTAAINEGVEVSAVKRGTKLEKAIGELAAHAATIAAAPAQAAKRLWR